MEVPMAVQFHDMFTKSDIIARLSMAERLAYHYTPEERAKVLAEIAPTEAELESLMEDWHFWARPNQIAPGSDCECSCRGRWLNWVIIAGRGWGKTRTGAEWTHEVINNGTYRLMHLVGATAADARDIMVLGESGILHTQKKRNPVTWSPTKRRLTWANGAEALVFSADEPDRLRGLQCEAAWADELASWRYESAWSQLALGLRLGPFPRTVITTTPQAKPLVKKLIKDEKNHLTRGTTYDNTSNLADAFIREITTEFEGKRFGRQEIYAEILDDSELAYWTRDLIEKSTVDKDEVPVLKKVVIGVDVAVSFGAESAETGIVVCGYGMNDVAYVLHDASGKYRPDGWAKKVSALYHEWNKESPEVRVVAEKNMGYELIRHTIQVEDPTVPVKLVHASKSKLTRAEPVATAYERGKVKHVGSFPKLEEQMCSWEAGDPHSPDRLDALVWALTELVVGRKISVAMGIVSNELGEGENYWRAIG
jgi:phage terminase large subunit-like protein